jgi:hypothetical protein
VTSSGAFSSDRTFSALHVGRPASPKRSGNPAVCHGWWAQRWAHARRHSLAVGDSHCGVYQS